MKDLVKAVFFVLVLAGIAGLAAAGVMIWDLRVQAAEQKQEIVRANEETLQVIEALKRANERTRQVTAELDTAKAALTLLGAQLRHYQAQPTERLVTPGTSIGKLLRGEDLRQTEPPANIPWGDIMKLALPFLLVP